MRSCTPGAYEQLLAVLSAKEAKAASAAAPSPQPAEWEKAHQWETWVGWKLSDRYPPLRMILVWDNLAGHRNFPLQQWLSDHGIMPLYTPVGGSWLNMAESMQRILVRRALSGQHPQTAQEVIDWLEQTVEGWNNHPTPFVWNGKRRRRRERARVRRLAGSGAALVKGYALAS